MTAEALPTNWTRRRLRFDAALNPVKSELRLADDVQVSFVPMEAVGELGGLRLDEQRSVDEVYNGYTYFRENDVVVAKITPCFENGKGALAIGLMNDVAFGTTELHVVRATHTLDPTFLFYVTIAHDFRCYGAPEMLGAGGQKRVPERFLKDWRPPLPSIETQRRIAIFLDEKTAQIDGLIGKKRALLERLAEKRQAIVTEAVTKGLNLAAPMKDSGIDWLGQIPAHWEVKRLSFVSQVIDCKHRTPEYIEEGVPLVSTTEISPYQIDYQTKRQVSKEELAIMSEGGRQPRIGDIIYSRNASVGSAALVRDDRTLCLGQDLCLIRLFTIFPCLLEHFLNSTACLMQLESYLVGATFKRVNVDVIKKYMFPLPPKDEQVQIATFLHAVITKTETTERTISDSIASLAVYRSALITAAVTGRIEELR